RRSKVSISLDPALLAAVDAYVQKQPDVDRSKVMESALQNWVAGRQNEAMREQFSAADETPDGERRSWRAIRRAAASKRLGKTGR
ncbi:MAG TPA: hypothetical protein VIT43_10265, partial [Candidatus Dormibacteraeota bacterium]